MSKNEIAAEAVGEIVLEFKEASERLEGLKLRAKRICEDSATTSKALCPESMDAILRPSVPSDLPSAGEVNNLLSEIRQAGQTINNTQRKLERMGLPSKF